MDAKAELEALNRLRNEKLKLIAEKRQHVEELRKRKAEKEAAKQVNTEGMSTIAAKMAEASAKEKLAESRIDGCLDSLLAEIFSGKGAAAPAAKKVIPERPLSELQQHAKERPRENLAADRSLSFQQESGLNRLSIDPFVLTQYERACQTDVTGDELQDQTQKKPALARSDTMNSNTLNKWAARARDRTGSLVVTKQTTMAELTKSGTIGAFETGRRLSLDLKPMSAEERERVEQLPEFRSFFDKTTLLVERALGQQDLEVDAVEEEEEEEDDGANSTREPADSSHEVPEGQQKVGIIEGGGTTAEGEGEGEEGSEAKKPAAPAPAVEEDDVDDEDDKDYDGIVDIEPMSFMNDYLDDRKVYNRAVTDVRYSPHHPGIFLASYCQRENASLSDPDGCMLVWNIAMPKRPELVFTCPTRVLMADFHRKEPHLFYGGTYTGSIVLWDARAKKDPVQKSQPGQYCHTAPVQALEQVGSANATNLFTASSDGRLCAWALSNMSEPFDTIDLCYDNKSRRELPVMAMNFHQQDINTFYAGGEDGQVCQCHIHGKVGIAEVYDGHDGPVTGIDVHPSASGDDSLALTSSFDWSLKLWKVKQEVSPVLSLDCFDDYVYDVKWHPKHPAIFAAVDGEGHVDLWNLNESTESPWRRLSTNRKLALNRCHFSPDGRRLVAGDSEGYISVFNIDKKLCHPTSRDVIRFQDTVRALQPIRPQPAAATASGKEGGRGLESPSRRDRGGW